MSLPRLVALIGSGETGPSMGPLHRRWLGALGGARVALLDTSYGFQANADDLTSKISQHFSTSLGCRLQVASLRDAAAADPLAQERFLETLDSSAGVFAGPGSPSYALEQWSQLPVSAVLRAKLRSGGAVVFASAASIVLGAEALPVYEIYKVGAPLSWRPGLDVFGELGWRLAVVPHFDNAEGGGHDTRYCYMGEARMRRLLEMLDPSTVVLGIDEHTALLVDLDAAVATVWGRGGVTVIRAGEWIRHKSGAQVPLALLSGVAGAALAKPAAAAAPPRAEFDDALERRDVDAAVAAVLALEERCGEAAGADREQLRRFIVALGDMARTGVQSPRDRVAPMVEVLLEQRRRARAERRFDDADGLRGALDAAGVEVRDTATGCEWELREPLPG